MIMTVCLALLVIGFSLFTLQAISWWRVSRRMATLVKIILVISLIIVSNLITLNTDYFCIFEQILITAVFLFLTPSLRVFFALSVIAQYMAVCSLTVLMKGLIPNTQSALKDRVRRFIYPLHLLYIIVFVFGMTNEIGAVCSASTMIPAIFYIKDICFFLYYVIMLWIRHNNFFIDW